MKTQKHHRKDKLQKSSIIFLQLGLVLAMLFVYVVLETKIEKKEFVFTHHEISDPEIYIFPEAHPVIEIERPDVLVETVEPLNPKKLTDVFILDEPESKKPDSPIEIHKPKSRDAINKEIENLPVTTETPKDEPILFVILEEAPIFPGCEDLSKSEAKLCFTKKLARFVNKKFNTDLAEDLGLQGKQNIHVQFIIDENGKVSDIKSRASHKRLELEAKRIIEKLPQMIPGMQRKRPVPVKYTLPISFQVY